MSRILKGRKRFLLGVVAALAISVAAFAYWTTGGSGDGTADVADAATGTIELEGTIADLDFRPGHTSDITVEATNTDLETDLRVQNTTLSNITTDAVGCLPAWFSSSAAPVAQNQTIEANTSEDLGAVHEITFNNVDVNQDACKGAVVSFDLVSD
jgi:hypothetical protein